MTWQRFSKRGQSEPFKRISIQEAKELMERGDVQIVDVRTPAEFASGHVPGAVNIPLDTVLQRGAELADDKDLIFVCGVGERSAVAAEMAASLGKSRLHNLEGGTQAWRGAGYPIE